MKKFLSVLFIFLVALTLTGCDTFKGQDIYNHPESNPQVTTVMVMLNKGVKFNIGLFNGPDGLLAKINSMPDTTIKITHAKFLSDIVEAVGETAVYSLQLTIANVPDQVVTIDTDVFFKTRTHTVFNPIKLMPKMPEFTYYIGITSARRHSSVTTENVQRNQDGEYVYFWNDDTDIIFTDVFPNQFLYYIFAIVGTVLIGVIIYFTARYFNCKKKNKNI